jgi:outer membrane protein assembly factor BamB
MRRKTWALSALAASVLVAGGAGAAWWVVHQRTGDIHRGADLPFTPSTSEPTTSTSGGHRKHHGRDPGPAWPVYGRTLTRTRDASDITDVAPPYRNEWKDGTGFLEYPPSYRDGVLYLASNNGFVSARTVNRGKVLWSFHIRDGVTGEPAVAGNRVFVGGRDDVVYAFGARTGHVVWTRRVSNEIESSPAFGGGRLYMSDIGGHVRALDMRTGRVLWTFTASGPVKHGPALAGGRLFFGDYAGVMYCISAATGRLIWRTATHGLASGFSSGNFYSTPAVAYGRVYIGNTDNKVYAFEAGDGQIAWTYTMPYWAYGSPGVAAGRVYATSYDGTFAALSARTGRLLWKHKLPYKTTASPTVIGRLVYVGDLGAGGSAHGHLTAFDAVTGRKRWFFNDGKYSTVIAADGRLIVAGVSHLYALLPRTRP